MEAIIKSCARIFAKASEEAHGQIVGAAVELARVEDENDILRAALKEVMREATTEYLLSAAAEEIGQLIGFDPMEVLNRRFEQVSA